jgi:hypothetical protein
MSTNRCFARRATQSYVVVYSSSHQPCLSLTDFHAFQLGSPIRSRLSVSIRLDVPALEGERRTLHQAWALPTRASFIQNERLGQPIIATPACANVDALSRLVLPEPFIVVGFGGSDDHT